MILHSLACHCIVLSVCSNTSFSLVVFVVLFYPTSRNPLSVRSSVTFFTPSEITAPKVSGCSQTVAVSWLNQSSLVVVWVTRPERPKGVKDEVKQARRAKSRPEGLPSRSLLVYVKQSCADQYASVVLDDSWRTRSYRRAASSAAASRVGPMSDHCMVFPSTLCYALPQ